MIPYFVNWSSMLLNICSALDASRPCRRFISKICFITLPNFSLNMRTVTGNIFLMPTSLFASSNTLNDCVGHCVKSIQILSFFLSVFSYIQTENGDLLRKSVYSVQMQEKTDKKKLRICTLFTQWVWRIWVPQIPDLRYS